MIIFKSFCLFKSCRLKMYIYIAVNKLKIRLICCQVLQRKCYVALMQRLALFNDFIFLLGFIVAYFLVGYK